MKRLLVLGGLGLVAREVTHLMQKEYDEIIVADARCVDGEARGKFRHVCVNLLEVGSLSTLIKETQPSMIINGVNVATLFSNQGIEGYDRMVSFYMELYHLLSDLTSFVHYVQIGTTGSGGLGLNIPFTHGGKVEEYPIIRKAACAGITTALLTLLSRSFPEDRVRVSEIKPGLIIFSHHIQVEEWEGARLVVADGGENGRYAREELALVTSIMGFTSVAILAKQIVSVIGADKQPVEMVPHDTVSAMNAAIVVPEKKNARVLSIMLKKLEQAQGDTYIIATGDLGPPSLTRDLLLAFGIIHGLSMHDTYEAFIAVNDSLTKTWMFIQERSPILAAFIRNTSTAARFRELEELYESGDAPWQLVRKALYAEM